MGLTRYERAGDRPPFLSFLSMEWGLVADVDLNTESLRFLGMLRSTLGALYYIFRHKQHRATLSWLPVSTEASEKEATIFAPSTLPPLDAPLPSNWRSEPPDATSLRLRRNLPSPRNIHVAGGAAARLRRLRGISTSRPRWRRDPPPWKASTA